MSRALGPVGEAIYAILQDATLQAAATGGVYGDVPEEPSYPFVWFELLGDEDIRGFGTGEIPEIELRVHANSLLQTASEAQNVCGYAEAVLRDATLTIDGYTQAGKVVYRNSVKLPNQTLFGVKTYEVVDIYTIWAERN